MGETRKLYSSEIISGQNAATNTRGTHINNQVKRADAGVPRINGIHRRIRVRLKMSVAGRYRGYGNHCMEKIMEPIVQIVTDNAEKHKRHTINLRLRDDRLTVQTNFNGRSGGTPHTNKYGYLLRQHNDNGM